MRQKYNSGGISTNGFQIPKQSPYAVAVFVMRSNVDRVLSILS